MLKNKKLLIFVLAACSLMSVSASASNTWLLNEEQNWDLIATDEQKLFIGELAEVQNLVNDGKKKEAQKKFAAIKRKYPEYRGKELNLFVKAEMLLAKMKLSESARNYDKLLSKYPESILRRMSIKRMYEIGTTFLSGHKNIVLGLLPLKGDSEGISILEKMTDHAGFDSPMAIDASVKIAKNYEKRKKFSEAYLKWYEIYSLGKTDATTKRDALYGMAQAKQAIYNDNPESKKPFYDASSLRAARNYYEMLQTYYSDFAQEKGVNEILNVITEQLAYKELSIGLYYQKIGNIQSANLYYDMIINNWPKSKSAEIAQNKLNQNSKS